jgi:hypothetical protein
MRPLLAFLALLLISSCDPVKRVMGDPKKKAKARSQFLDEGICRPDTFLLVITDTLETTDTVEHLYLSTDTIHSKDTVYIVRTRWRDILKTITIRDTIVRQIEDTRRLDDMRMRFESLEATLDACVEDKRRNFWWLLAFGVIIGALVTFIIKRA